MAKRNKKKLNSNQANGISIFISILYFLCMLVYGVISHPTGEDAFYYWLIGCFIGTTFIYLIFYYMIFKGDEAEDKERIKEIKNATMQCLSYTDFKQVYVIGLDNIMNEILQKEECKFYAKLTEGNNIYLIVKDKHEEVLSEEIQNYVYFNNKFKIK